MANSSAAPLTFPDLLRRLWDHLAPRRRRQVALLSLLILLSAFAETVSLGAVLPFLGILTSPQRVLSFPIVMHFMRAWGITSADQLVLPFAIAFAVTALVAGAFRMLVLWVSTRIAFATGADFSNSVYRRTLYQPYRVHVASNSSDVISGITGKVAETVNTLTFLLLLLSSCVLLVFITLTLFAIDPAVALAALVGFGSCYVLITAMARRRLRSDSQRIADEHTQVVKALQEGLGGIRDVLLDGTQPVYCDTYRKADYGLRRAQGDIVFVSGSPRFVMEAIGMVLIAALAYGISRRAEGIAAALPVLGALAMGAQRLLPALQQAYSAWAGIVGSQASMVKVLELLDQPIAADTLPTDRNALIFNKEVRFINVRFRYGPDAPWVLDKFNLTIRKGTRVGFVGSTGSGKSTVLDLLMGLLTPTEGELLVDGEPLAGGRIRPWQKAIAHVPQSIFLADTSLAQNIAFGVPPHLIELERVKQAARRAQIAEFIENRPEGYDARVGERGIQLSGGQRQRIGIARALYKQASVLVFDEATSALDNATEQSVMDAIDGLDRELTILLIAHRLSTVRRCDTIVEIGEGRVIAQGTFVNLLESSASFQNMVRMIA
ncbi:MAG: ABC transporter ATP-binding protein [Steroidobacteraceae bacterium]